MKMPNRTRTIKLAGEYQGFECTVNSSMPMYIFTYLQTGNWDLIQSALSHAILAWNFSDEEGNALPQPKEKIPALDVFGKPVSIPVLDDGGEPVLDDNEKPVMEQVFVPGIALIPIDLGMTIVKQINENIGDTPDP